MEGDADRAHGIYSIGAVSRLLGIATQTLRCQGGALRTDRARSGAAAGSGSSAATRWTSSALSGRRSPRAYNRPTLTGSSRSGTAGRLRPRPAASRRPPGVEQRPPYCSPNATRMPPSSPSTSYVPRALLFASCWSAPRRLTPP